MKLLDIYGPFLLLAIIRAVDEVGLGIADKEYIYSHANETLIRWGRFERSKEQIDLALGALCEIGCLKCNGFYTLGHNTKDVVAQLVSEIREVL